jgi:hypothetical protein
MGSCVSAWGQSWGLSWGSGWGPVAGNSCWGVSWGDSWGVSWNIPLVIPVTLPGVNLLGVSGGGGWTGMPRYGEEPPVIRLRPSLPGSKARKLGDAEQPLGMESADSLSRRGGLGGGIGRVQRVVRPSVGVAAAGLGGPAPAPAPGAPGGRPTEPRDVQIV